MMQNPQVATKVSASYADRLGICASALCVVHCIATPVLLSLSAVFAHYLPTEERTHRALAMGVALLGVIALWKGFSRHKRIRILFLMGSGLACIFYGAYFGDRMPSHLIEVLITGCGSSLMITAHRLNHTFCRACERCT